LIRTTYMQQWEMKEWKKSKEWWRKMQHNFSWFILLVRTNEWVSELLSRSLSLSHTVFAIPFHNNWSHKNLSSAIFFFFFFYYCKYFIPRLLLLILYVHLLINARFLLRASCYWLHQHHRTTTAVDNGWMLKAHKNGNVMEKRRLSDGIIFLINFISISIIWFIIF
jgi:hypothetical protein